MWNILRRSGRDEKWDYPWESVEESEGQGGNEDYLAGKDGKWAEADLHEEHLTCWPWVCLQLSLPT